MAKRDTYGYRAELIRRKIKTRIKGISTILENKNLPKRLRDSYEATVLDLRMAQAGTRTRTKSGKKIVGRTKEKLETSLKVAEKLAADTEVYTGNRRRGFLFTQNQLNAASAGADSVFTKAEVKIFYRATQKAWEGKSSKINRNQAILEYYGRSNLESLVEEVLEINKLAVKAASLDPTKFMTDEQREEYEKAQQADTTDGEKGSPTYMAAVVTLEEFQNLVEEPERQ